MNNKCILKQLGYKLNDERVSISSDDYLDIRLADNLFVGANRDCSSITVHTYNKDLLDIDLHDFETILNIEFRIPVLLYFGYKPNAHRIYEEYEAIVKMDSYGVDKYWRKQGAKEEELLFHINKHKYSADDITAIILNSIESSEETIEGIDIKETVKIIGNAINPLIKKQIENANRLFDTRKPTKEKIQHLAMRSFLYNPPEGPGGLINDEGTGVYPVPEVKEHKLVFTPSGLKNPNAWRNK